MIEKLLAAVANDPDDLDARRVLADFFSQQGDPRGELMQLELVEEPSVEIKKRIKQLHADHDATWLAPFSAIGGGLAFDLDRGLVGIVSGPVSAIATHQANIVKKAALVTTVKLWGPDLAGLENSALLARARSLTIAGAGKKLRASTLDLPELRTLVLDAVALGPEEMQLLVDAAPKLQRLTISGCRLNKNAEAPLAKLVHLRELDFPAGGLGSNFGVMLGEFRELVKLRIPGMDLDDAGVRAILPALRTVEDLDLRGNVSLAVLDDLLAALDDIRVLELGTRGLGDAVCSKIAAWSGASKLTRLHLGESGVTSAGAIVLAECAALANLTSLVLSGSKFTDAAKQALVESPYLAKARIYAGDRQLARPKDATSTASPTGSRRGPPSKSTTGPKRTARR